MGKKGRKKTHLLKTLVPLSLQQPIHHRLPPRNLFLRIANSSRQLQLPNLFGGEPEPPAPQRLPRPSKPLAQSRDDPHQLQQLLPHLRLPRLDLDLGHGLPNLDVDGAVGDQPQDAAQLGGDVVGPRGGVGAEGEEGGEVGVVGEEVGLDLRLDAAGVGVEPLDEESEVGGGERGRRVADVAGGEEVPDVDRVEEGVHLVGGGIDRREGPPFGARGSRSLGFEGREPDGKSRVS